MISTYLNNRRVVGRFLDFKGKEIVYHPVKWVDFSGADDLTSTLMTE